MINKIKLLSLVFFLVGINLNSYSADDVFIVYKVENQLISNIDIENEAKYLTALNSELKNIGNKKILELAKSSILKETIKKIELEKYYVLNQKNPYLNEVIKNLYLKLELNNEIEFAEYLKNYGLNIPKIKKKVEIESTWNELIFRKYKSLVKINKQQLLNKIKKEKKLKKKSYLLSEIVFTNTKDKKIIESIKNSIKEIGFNNTANIYSVSDTSKFGGKIGWIDEQSLNSDLYKIVTGTKIGAHTDPIRVGNNFLILRVEDIKENLIEINEESRLNKIIEFETDRQLSQYSKIYYNKIKINTKLSEL
tara:strand:+ start:490 stop:1413 length:924 start_codon:yes stop_codon:yes gene_type:complete